MKDQTVLFSSWDEAIDLVEQGRGHVFADAYAVASDVEWRGTATWEEAVHLARAGWADLVEQSDHLVRLIEDRVIADRALQTTFEATYDVTGSEVDVARYLAGEPECMVEAIPVRVAKAGRAVRLVVTTGVQEAVESEAIVRRGAAIVALADLLARLQHPLDIWVGSSEYHHHATYLIHLQHADQPLDRARLLFAVAHPAAHRRIGFALRCNLWPHWYRDSDVGRSTTIYEETVPVLSGTTVHLPVLLPGAVWDEASAVAWIDTVLDQVFAGD